MKASYPVLALIAAVSLAITPKAPAEVYRVVDSEGRVTFTDQPPADNEQMQPVSIQQPNTQPALKAPETKSSGKTSSVSVYDSVRIVQPGADSTIPPGQLDLIVQISTSPAIALNHRIQLLFDGAPWGDPAAATSFVIDNLIRGSHQLQAQVINDIGEVIASSPSVTIYVKRGSRLNQGPKPGPAN